SLAYKDVIGQLNAAGVVVVASAGNEGLAVGSPASCPGVIAVAGVRHSGTKVGYSDLGPEITVAAPAGNCVNLSGTCLFPLLTTSNKGTTTPVAGLAGATYTSGGADVSLGTSFAAPLVAGSVGLMLSAHPALKPSQVMRALKATARTFPSTGAGAGVQACAGPSSTAQESECYCTTSTCGAGLLDARNAVAAEPMVAAGIRATSINIVVGVAATLDGAVNSAPSGTATLTGYFWSVISGPALIDSATNGSAVTLTANGVGTVVVGLTVTDSTGQQDSTSIALDATAASLAPPAASSGGGGGAMELGWLLGWLASVVGIWRVTPRRPAR
ncbi:MAG: S8 family serine peptidase, partial [Burkholderiaceae bacterium]